MSKMNMFLALEVFVRVVEAHGFTAASRKLDMSVSAVTKIVARLEDALGAQLFNRTTRRISTTQFGIEFYERAKRILADLHDAEVSLQAGNIAPRGRVRVVVPLSFGRVTVVPQLPRFFERYPDIVLDLNFTDSSQPLDIIGESYDLAVRTGEIVDSRFVTRILTRSPQITVASQAYLARRGVPETPSDLVNHNCIVGSLAGSLWRFQDRDGTQISIHVSGNMIVNNGDALREAAAVGLGIVQGTSWLFRKDIEIGSVTPLLPEFALEGGAPISVLYPANRHLPGKVRAFVDFLVAITRGG